MKRLLAASLLCAATCVQAGPGDVYVPAHRTRDGSFVPANVPPSSGGSALARRPASAQARSAARGTGRAGIVAFANAPSLRR